MIKWRKYNGAIIPDIPPHINADTNDLEIKIKENKVYFARWTTDFDSRTKENFWYVICDNKSELSDYSKNTRSKINRGLKQCEVRIIDKKTIVELGYEVYSSAFENYETYLKAKSKKEFVSQIEETQSDWEFWGVFYNGKMIAYSKNKLIDNYCEYASLKFEPDFLRYYSSYALFYTMNTYYLNEKNFKYVNNGARSISHSTNIQDLLIQKFLFRQAYCKLHILYTPTVKILVDVLFPFRHLLKMLSFLSLIRINTLLKINILLKQEEMSRQVVQN